MALTITAHVDDRNARANAVPFRGSIWGYDYTDASERSLKAQYFNGHYGSGIPTVNDVQWLSGSEGYVIPAKINAIRILQPHYGQVISCFLDMKMLFDSGDNGKTCKLAIGTFASGAPLYTPNTTYSGSYINQSWVQISGTSTPMTVSGGVIQPNTLNLLPALYPSTSAAFQPDAFVLLICFDRVPNAVAFELVSLNLHMSVQGIQ